MADTGLDARDKLLLGALDSRGGLTAGQLASQAWGSALAWPEARKRLLRLRSAGLAIELDAESPTAWLRTDAGTAALVAR